MSNSDLINELISKEFEQQYFEECKHIWQNYVPLKGKSNCLQGELLREQIKNSKIHKNVEEKILDTKDTYNGSK